MPDDIQLSVNSKLFTGWKSLSVTDSLQQLATTFSFSHTAQVSEGDRPLPLEEGQECIIKTNSEEILTTGYIDSIDDSYDATNQSTEVSGRSATGDLVDCSAIYKSGQWRGAALLDIAQNLCDPFGISVASEVSLGAKFRRFSLQDSESVYEALERACRMRGLLMNTRNDGALLFTRSGVLRVNTVLRRGENILTGSRTRSMSGRFRKYILKAQAAGDDSFSGQPATQLKRTSIDQGVPRYRPLIIGAENEDSGKELQERADWERNVRAGRARSLTYTVQGWRDNDGNLWKPNRIVHVSDNYYRIEDDLLITSVTYSKSDQGTITTLEVTRKESLDVQPFAPPKVKDEDESGALFDIAKLVPSLPSDSE